MNLCSSLTLSSDPFSLHTALTVLFASKHSRGRSPQAAVSQRKVIFLEYSCISVCVKLCLCVCVFFSRIIYFLPVSRIVSCCRIQTFPRVLTMCVKACLNAFHAPSLSPSVIRTVFLPDSGLVSRPPMRIGNLRLISQHFPLFLVSEQSCLDAYAHVYVRAHAIMCKLPLHGSLAGLAESGQCRICTVS